MPAINFKAEYAPKILDGSKPFTLRKRRADYRDPAPIGTRLGLFTGMRTKSCRKFAGARTALRFSVSFNHAGIVGMSDTVDMPAPGGEFAEPARQALLVEVAQTFRRAFDYPAGPETPARLERIAAWDGFASWADLWAFHSAYHLDGDGVATRELIGFGHVTATGAL